MSNYSRILIGSFLCRSCIAAQVKFESIFFFRFSFFKTYTAPDQFENGPITCKDLCLRKTRSWKSHDYRDVIVFEKFRFRDRLVWTVGLTGEIKLRFQI